MSNTEAPKPKIAPGSQPTRRYPEFIKTDAVVSYLRDIYMRLDDISFNLRSTINNIVANNMETEASAPTPEEASTTEAELQSTETK